MKNIIIYTNRSTFIARDIEMLKSDEWYFDNKKTWILMSFWQQIIHFAWTRYDNYIIWFGDYHALIPVLFSRLFKRKSFIVVAGFDAMSIPEINYGIFYKKGLRQWMVKKAYKLCTKILPVDSSLMYGFNEYNHQPTGLLHFMPKINPDKIKVIKQGIDTNKWKPKNILRPYDFITVGNIDNDQTYYRKGIDVFMKMARMMPDKIFLVVGYEQYTNQNIHSFGFLPISQVKRLMNRSKVYCQFSLAEGIPNTLIEAMAMGCVPCVTDVNGMSRIVGDTGVVISDKKEIYPGMFKALVMSNKESIERVKIVDTKVRKQEFKKIGIV